MKTFISPIYIQTNSLSQEKVCIGLIGISSHKVFFNYSKGKLAIIEKLNSNKLSDIIINTLNLIKNKINQESLPQKPNLFKTGSIFTIDYFNYLSKYSQNLVQFAEPKPFSQELTQTDFDNLFVKFVGFEEKKESGILKNVTLSSKIKTHLSKPVFIEKTDIDYCISPENVKGIISDVHVLFISKNGSILTGQDIDFNNNVDSVKKNINEYVNLVYALMDFSTKHKLKTNGNFKLIAEEPELNTPQHKIFDNIYSNELIHIDIITPDELTKIEDQLLSEKYSKFSSLFQ